VLRHTVGYQNQFGGRRTDAALSYSYIQDYAGVRHRPTLAEAIKDAIDRRYICRVVEGRFDPEGGECSQSARYSLNWLAKAANPATGSKTEPGVEQFKNRTESGSESVLGKQFKNRTPINTSLKDTSKQQQGDQAAAKNNPAYQLLHDAGFDEQTALDLSARRSPEEIQQQINWLEHRKPRANAIGLLRKAIEQNWPPPHAVRATERQQQAHERDRQREAEQAVEDQRQHQRDAQRRERWFALARSERAAIRQEVIASAHPRFKSFIQNHSIDDELSFFYVEMEKQRLCEAA
jgi:hypothetical protein